MCLVPQPVLPHHFPAICWLLLTTGPLHQPPPLPGSTQIPPPQKGFPRCPRYRPGTLLNAFTESVTTCLYVFSCFLSVSPIRLSGP